MKKESNLPNKNSEDKKLVGCNAAIIFFIIAVIAMFLILFTKVYFFKTKY
ncbi:hypothetical protein [Flavobacterium humidisoli]|uniref:Uncharacterized protein n=1 Tax=Flavobacterium humidisoli TaxID=2937442 RepID=A0ABY4LV65_9FLAO|nr:hypothetical protein [Flavobacterium humidisoli]UPZ16243.1 hypothetical protein M0M44_02580 [Flavobacterium humidisoli]